MDRQTVAANSNMRVIAVLVSFVQERKVQRRWRNVLPPSLPSNPCEAGIALRVGRAHARLSLEKVRDITDVPMAILDAFEHGDPRVLPSPEAVSVGLRRFADAIGLDGESLEKAYLNGAVFASANDLRRSLKSSPVVAPPVVDTNEIASPHPNEQQNPSRAEIETPQINSTKGHRERRRRTGNVSVSRRRFERGSRKAISLVTATCLVASFFAAISSLPAGAISASIFAFGSNGFACSGPGGGNVYCWGANVNNGELGNGTTTGSVGPVEVEGVGGTGFLSGVVSIAASAFSVCAATSDGSVYCWGAGTDGALGNNSTTDSDTPVQVEGVGGTGFLSGITSVVGMESQTFCALTSTAAVYCWGNNANGQDGNNTSDATETTPVQVAGSGGTGFLTSVTSLSSDEGVAVCAVVSTNVYCWGNDAQGQIGTTAGVGNTTGGGFETPQEVQGIGGTGVLSNIVSVSMGREHACALTSGSNVICWGLNNVGELGNGTSNPVHHPPVIPPVEVEGVGGTGFLSGVTQLSAGGDTTCAITTTNTAYCWGAGYLGNNTGAQTSTPIAVDNPAGTTTWTGVTNIWVEWNVQALTTTCATTSGVLYCWGINLGALGFNASNNTLLPAQVGLFNGSTASTTSLSVSPNPGTSGQSVTLTATVSGSSPTGSVTFYDELSSLGAATLNGLGVATFATSALTVGTHTLSAAYAGDGGNLSSNSSTVSESVSPASAPAPVPATVTAPVGNTGLAAVVTPTIPTPTVAVSPPTPETSILTLRTPEGSVSSSSVTLGFTCQSDTPCDGTGYLSVARLNRTRPDRYTHLILAIGHIDIPPNNSTTASFVITSTGNIVLPERRHFYRNFRMTLQMIDTAGVRTSHPVRIPG